jgi:OTU domain-containing protein 5
MAMTEIYNRRIEVYEYEIEPKNTFQSVFQTDYEPIRLSYHDRNHYNSIVDPYKATIGLGLGLPGFVPGVSVFFQISRLRHLIIMKFIFVSNI